MTNEERKERYMNRNIKLFPALCALTWDIIFVWTISMMFFSTQKGLEPSQIIALDSILMLAGCILVVPVGKLFQNVSPIVATRIGMCGYGGYLLLVIFGTSYPIFIIAQLFLAFGYSVMSVKTNSVLTNSLQVVKRDKDYQRTYGKGVSIFYAIESIGAILITYVYNWQPYMAYWMSFAIVVGTILFSFLFVEPKKFQDKNVDIKQTQELAKSKKPDSYFKILASLFFIALLVFMFLMRGVLSIAGSSFKLYLQGLIDVGTLPVWAFGYIYAAGRLCVSLASNFQFKFNLKFGVRSIIIIAVASIVTFVLNGLMFIYCDLPYLNLVVISVSSFIQMSLFPICRIFVNNYMQVCIHKKNIERAYSIRTMVEYLGYAAVSGLYAAILGVNNDHYGFTSLIHISIYIIPIIIATAVFIHQLCRKHAQKYTIIRTEYTED